MRDDPWWSWFSQPVWRLRAAVRTPPSLLDRSVPCPVRERAGFAAAIVATNAALAGFGASVAALPMVIGGVGVAAMVVWIGWYWADEA